LISATVWAKASVPMLTGASVAGNGWSFTVMGSTGSNYAVQVATNFGAGNWATVATYPAPFVFTDASNQATQRFYRAILP